MIEDQNIKIEALENKIESQNKIISDLKIKMLEGQKKELQQLQNQINLLKLKNSEKEDLIRKLDGDSAEAEDSEDSEDDNVQTLQEVSLPHAHASPNPTPASVRYEIFLKNSLRHLDEMELGIKRSRKMSIIRDKYKVYSEKIENEFMKYEIKSTIYDMAIKRLKECLKSPEDEVDKDQYLSFIYKCRNSLNS